MPSQFSEHLTMALSSTGTISLGGPDLGVPDVHSPSSPQPGLYCGPAWLAALIDPSLVITETNEGNNMKIIPVNVLCPNGEWVLIS